MERYADAMTRQTRQGSDRPAGAIIVAAAIRRVTCEGVAMNGRPAPTGLGLGTGEPGAGIAPVNLTQPESVAGTEEPNQATAVS